jgi:acetyltransferase-like isoleucine patch superfamily enzyme
VKRPSWGMILKRLYWDLAEPAERVYYGFWLIANIPGIFGNMLRARYVIPRLKRCGHSLTVMAGCRFRSIEHLEVGDNVTVGYDDFLQARGGLTIGNNVIIGPGVRIWSVNHRYDDPDAPVYDQGHDAKPVRLADNVFVGAASFILPGAVLNEGCIVVAGTVVSGKEYPSYAIIAGNPARIIGYRGGRTPDAQRAAAAAAAGAAPDTPTPPPAASAPGADTAAIS